MTFCVSSNGLLVHIHSSCICLGYLLLKHRFIFPAAVADLSIYLIYQISFNVFWQNFYQHFIEQTSISLDILSKLTQYWLLHSSDDRWGMLPKNTQNFIVDCYWLLDFPGDSWRSEASETVLTVIYLRDFSDIRWRWAPLRTINC